MTEGWTARDADDALRAAGHAIVVTDTAAVIRFWNEAATALFGWSEADAIGRPINELLDPRGPDHDSESMRRMVAGEPRATEFRARRKDGSAVPVLVSVRPIRTADGTITGVIGSAVDISARVEAEAAAASAAARLDIVGAIATIGTWEWDLTTDEMDGDRCLSDMHGNDPDSPWSVESWMRSVHPDDRRLMAEAVNVDFATGLLPEVRYRVVHPDGSVRVLLGRGQVMEWRDGRPVRLGGVCLDVTDAQRDAQRVLDTLEMMSDGYLELDAEFRVTYVNRAAEQLLGQGREQLLGQVLWDRFPGALGTVFEAHYRAAMQSGVPSEFEAYFAPHEAWYDVRVYPNDDALSIYFRNINDRRATMEAQERTLAAERSARVATELASRKLEHAATHDPLTGLANRVALERYLASALDADGHSLAVMFCDLDRFKTVNDGLGHDAGDEILVQVADRLRSCVRDGDLVARIGGDEFVVAAHVEDRAAATALAARVLEVVREPVSVSGRRLVTTISVGIAYGDERSTPQTLLRDADAAVYRSKGRGRNQASEFDDALRADAVARLEIEHDLRVALDTRQLTVVYQPAFDVATGAAVGVEALVRWHHPTRGPVSPAEFIPLAEETGLIVPVGQRVMEVVAADLAGGTVGAGADWTVWVNVSGRELAEPTYVDTVRQRHRDLGGRLGLEVTETVLHEDPTAVGDVLARLAAGGVKLAIDDFGTGYSSLARLTEYHIDLVKIDQSFVAQLESPKHRAIVAAAVELAHALGARAVAEGVETADQLRGTQVLGCDLVSGYHLARPVTATELPGAIARGQRTIESLPTIAR
jgi:diguanylate cyclase (GGDEF)-like protein/PAS domain S-box-containing protein